MIGLYSPRAQSGKTTVAKHLETTMGAKRLSFADTMRDMTVPMLAPFFEGGETELREWYADDRKDHALIPGLNVTLRHVLQTLGTSWGRELIHPDVWVMATQRRARQWRESRPVVIDDVRYENEYAMIRKEGGLLVKIVRPDAPASENWWHVSENRLGKHEFDDRIQNDGDLSNLRNEAEGVADHWFGASTGAGAI